MEVESSLVLAKKLLAMAEVHTDSSTDGRKDDDGRDQMARIQGEGQQVYKL